MHGIFVWLYGPEHTLVTFQLQIFGGEKFPTFSIEGDQCPFFTIMRGVMLFCAIKNILIKEALFIERQILLKFE